MWRAGPPAGRSEERSDPRGRRSICPRQARPGCSTRGFAVPDRRVIEGQSVRLSANFLRPERRSTDGQVILKRTSGRSENRPDLLFCGAPLRNRTVDLLLTMDHCAVLQPQVEQLTCENTSTHWHSQAPDEPTRAPFATQSATHFDLGSEEPAAPWSSPEDLVQIVKEVEALAPDRGYPPCWGTHRKLWCGRGAWPDTPRPTPPALTVPNMVLAGQPSLWWTRCCHWSGSRPGSRAT